MDNYQSLTHSRYDCKYHVVFVPKMRKKVLFGKIRKYLKGGLARIGEAEGM
jgi:REP-associated tyrosine transposase